MSSLLQTILFWSRSVFLHRDMEFGTVQGSWFWWPPASLTLDLFESQNNAYTSASSFRACFATSMPLTNTNGSTQEGCHHPILFTSLPFIDCVFLEFYFRNPSVFTGPCCGMACGTASKWSQHNYIKNAFVKPGPKAALLEQTTHYQKKGWTS